jgi:hypothetical protein
MLNIFKNVIFVEMKISKLFSYSRNMFKETGDFIVSEGHGYSLVYLYNIIGFVRLQWSSFPSIRPVVHLIIRLSLHRSKARILVYKIGPWRRMKCDVMGERRVVRSSSTTSFG